MAKSLQDLIARSKNNTTPDNSVTLDSGKIIPFTFDGKEFGVAIKDDVMIFDANDVQISTISIADLAVAKSDFLQKVNEIVTSNTNQKIILFVNKASSVEKMTFSSLFDATYIFRKLVRIAGRSSEGISSIVIEKGDKVLRSYTNSKAKFMKSIGQEEVDLEDRDGRNDNKTELISVLSRIEDGMDDIIHENISNQGVQYDPKRVQKYIDLLTELQERFGTEE